MNKLEYLMERWKVDLKSMEDSLHPRYRIVIYDGEQIIFTEYGTSLDIIITEAYSYVINYETQGTPTP